MLCVDTHREMVFHSCFYDHAILPQKYGRWQSNLSLSLYYYFVTANREGIQYATIMVACCNLVQIMRAGDFFERFFFNFLLEFIPQL